MCYATLLMMALALLGATPGISGQCGDLSEATKGSLTNYIRQKYTLPAGATIEVSEKHRKPGCYRLLQFSLVNSTRPGEWEFALTPDQRFLVTELYDLSVEPAEDERQKVEEFRTELSAGQHPSLGSERAPVTITLFSDFQCPACKKAAGVLIDQVFPTERDRVRIIFRHMPLSIHPWARSAAISATCVSMQDETAFWTLHRFLFEKQSELTLENVSGEIQSYIEQQSSVDMKKYKQCVGGPEATQRVQDDIKTAIRSNVHATPTLFINEFRVEGAPTPEQLRSLIRQKGYN